MLALIWNELSGPQEVTSGCFKDSWWVRHDTTLQSYLPWFNSSSRRRDCLSAVDQRWKNISTNHVVQILESQSFHLKEERWTSTRKRGSTRPLFSTRPLHSNSSTSTLNLVTPPVSTLTLNVKYDTIPPSNLTSHRSERDNVVYLKTKGKINNDLAILPPIVQSFSCREWDWFVSRWSFLSFILEHVVKKIPNFECGPTWLTGCSESTPA